MTTDQLHAVHTARPFKPFDMVMGDGTRYHVPHPEYLAYAPKARTCTVYDRQGLARILDLLLMTALEHTGGHRGRRRAA